VVCTGIRGGDYLSRGRESESIQKRLRRLIGGTDFLRLPLVRIYRSKASLRKKKKTPDLSISQKKKKKKKKQKKKKKIGYVKERPPHILESPVIMPRDIIEDFKNQNGGGKGSACTRRLRFVPSHCQKRGILDISKGKREKILERGA